MVRVLSILIIGLLSRQALAYELPPNDIWNKGYRVRSSFWEPYTSDQDTLGLFHLDRTSGILDDQFEEEMEVVDDADQVKKAETDLIDDEGKRGRGGNVTDSGPQKLNAETVGPVEWLRAGRFGGSLYLTGGTGALLAPPYPDVKGKKTCTAELWVRPELPEAGHSVLLSLDSSRTKKSTVELRYMSTGALELACYGRVLRQFELKLVPGRWRHLAFVWGLERTARFAVYLDGVLEASVSEERLRPVFEDLEGVVRVGNNAAGTAGLKGTVDEFRVSRAERKFYARDIAWTDPGAKREIADSQPYLRDRCDLLFAVPFDGSVEPARAAPGTRVDLGPEPKPDARVKTLKPVFRSGVRGQALMVGKGLAMPIWAGHGDSNPARGAFELWFSPFDWDNRRKQGFHDPLDFVPVLRVVDRAQKNKQKKPKALLFFGVHHKRPMERKPAPNVEPGRWYHVIGNYENGQARLFLNGEPMPDATVYMGAAKPPKEPPEHSDVAIFLDPIQPDRTYFGQQTLIDELRLYSRPLTPLEAKNAHARFRPDAELTSLPFAHTEVGLNVPLRTFNLSLELLAPKRDRVSIVSVNAFGPGRDKPYARSEIREFKNGRGSFSAADAEVAYGKHRIELAFLDKDGTKIAAQTVEREHPAPPWLGNTIGVKDIVLPGWTPMEAEGRSVRFWGRELVIGGSGLPEKIISQQANILAAPIRIVASADDSSIPWQPVQEAPAIDKATDIIVVTRGALKGGDWELGTRITTEYDGLMKIESTLSGAGPRELDAFRIEIPLHARHALLMGYWSGARHFRAGTWHGLLPQKEGVLFASHNFRRMRNKDLKGSFIPQLFLGDDERGLEWFAENDRGWTKSMEVPALEVVRKDDVVTLRMNIIHQKTKITEPRTFVFGLVPTPLKALPKDFRSSGKALNFGFCDSFSKQQLKCQENYGNFNIYPEDYDWDAARKRAEMHAFHYKSFYGYRGPFLYIDRNWVGLPPNAREYAGIWYRSGHYRYIKEAQDCYVWHIDQWLKHKLIVGIYIDDAWIGTFRDPKTGPAYLMEDGQVQPGFEFFDYHETVKRLRWAFVDNGLRPTIWFHMTHTLFTPCLAFGEYLLDGEDRFTKWGVKWDFLDAWPAGRMRYNNGAKWGLVPTWFVKIGGDNQPTQPMPHWKYRQTRAYIAGTVVNDIVASGVPKEVFDEIYVDDAQFVGYWSPENPTRTDEKHVYVSTWRRKGQTIAMIVNRSKELLEEALLAIDIEKLGLPNVTRPGQVEVEDMDRFDPPKGVDLTKLETPKSPDVDEEETATLEDGDEFFEEVEKRDEQEEIEASGKVVLDDHNFIWKDGKLTLRIRPHDYRLLRFIPKPR